MSTALPRYCWTIAVRSGSRAYASLRIAAKIFRWWLMRRSWYATSTRPSWAKNQTFGETSPVTLALAGVASTCLLKYSSMPSMKIASGAFSARRRGTRWPSVSVEQAHEVVDDAVQLRIGEQRVGARAELEAVGGAGVLERRHRDRRQPHLRPRQRRCREEGDRL